MRYLQSFITVLAIFVVASTFFVPVDSSSNSPPEPDDAIIDSFKEWMDEWRRLNIDPAARKVHDAYTALSGLVGDYQSAINGVGGVAFSAVSGAVQDKWVGLVVSVYNTTKDLATGIAKTQTLQSAVEEGSSHHSLYLYYYHQLWNKHGTVIQGTVAEQVQTEISQNGGMLISANSLMEAFYKYEFLVRDYNAKVNAWNAYANRKNRENNHQSPSHPP